VEVTAVLASHTTPEVRALLGDALLHELSHGLRGP
jgi:diaminopimelate decarboxylase